MDLQKELLESSHSKSDKRSLRASVVSLVLHGVLLTGIVYAGAENVTHKVDSEKPINAFITQGAAPPPPPRPTTWTGDARRRPNRKRTGRWG